METKVRRVALVTGGSRGIGRHVVTGLARDGFDVAFCYRSDEEAARSVAQEAEKEGAGVFTARVDVADARAVRDFVRSTEDTLGPLHAAVSCAGIWDGPVDDAAIKAIADWKANAVRIPLNEEC
ncbi:SDR family NAD(P)-dependent oxidoreductase, partial [Streptomyces sp. NPDC007162]|uniref:SDR family NAD(P)-dependent oxidoreductase n=1 Tax=Streptomyces sp. NPDC007162 TaxID=3156917 RepID=UPI0033C29591